MPTHPSCGYLAIIRDVSEQPASLPTGGAGPGLGGLSAPPLSLPVCSHLRTFIRASGLCVNSAGRRLFTRLMDPVKDGAEKAREAIL